LGGLTQIRLYKDSLPGGFPSKPEQTRSNFGLPSNYPFAPAPSVGMAGPSMPGSGVLSASELHRSCSTPRASRAPFKSAIPKSGVKPHQRIDPGSTPDISSLPARTDKGPLQPEGRNSVTFHSTNQPIETAPSSNAAERSIMPASNA
jgi:hypothetical protein